MPQHKVWVFFYGSYMNFNVLREVELVPEPWEVARLDGFDIVIQPRANLVRSDQTCVYGIATTASHAELDRLYAHARDEPEKVSGPFCTNEELKEGPDTFCRPSRQDVAALKAEAQPTDLADFHPGGVLTGF